MSIDVLTSQQSVTLFKDLKVGMSRAEVTASLGEPHRQEIHGTTEFLFYKTTWQLADKANERVPIAIRDSKVVGWGNSYFLTFTKNETAPFGGWLPFVGENQL